MSNAIFPLCRFFTVLAFGFLLIFTSLSINFDWPNDVGYFKQLIYLNRLVSDFLQVAGAVILFCAFGTIGRIVAILISLVFSIIYFVQSLSYSFIGSYLPAIALENADHVDFLNLDNIVFSGFVWIVFAWLIFKLAKNTLPKVNWKASLILSLVLIIASTLIKNDARWLDRQIVKDRFNFYNSGRAGVKHKSPIGEFIRTYNDYLSYLKKQRFVRERPDKLSENAADFIYENVHYFGQHNPDYPLLRTLEFETPKFLEKQTDSGQGKTHNRDHDKNIIIIFSEGISARLIEPYNDRFPGLTPNILDFSKSAIRVTDYQNHSYATYRGLGGQLCSIFPVGRLYQKVNYYCLGHVLQERGYRTRFMVSQDLQKTDLDALFEKVGIQNIDGANSIAKLTNYSHDNKSIVPDRVLFEGLIERLKQEQDSDSKFMIGIYNFETHTGVKLLEKTQSYLGSPNNPLKPNDVLDTVFNFDREFGKFWEYFKKSNHYQDTIVVLTSDHATFPSKEYVKLVKDDPDYSRLFIDKIPLLIYHPDRSGSITIDADSATSIDFTPSIINILQIPKVMAPFLGESIFSDNRKKLFVDIAGDGSKIWFRDPTNTSWSSIADQPNENRDINSDKLARQQFLKYAESLERSNRLWITPLKVK